MGRISAHLGDIRDDKTASRRERTKKTETWAYWTIYTDLHSRYTRFNYRPLFLCIYLSECPFMVLQAGLINLNSYDKIDRSHNSGTPAVLWVKTAERR